MSTGCIITITEKQWFAPAEGQEGAWHFRYSLNRAGEVWSDHRMIGLPESAQDEDFAAAAAADNGVSEWEVTA